MNKQNLQNLLACVEIAQASGKISADAMAHVGMAYIQAKSLFNEMSESDVLVIKKNLSSIQLGEQSPSGRGKKQELEEAS